MTLSVCLIASEPELNKELRDVLARTGLNVWTAESVEAFERSSARAGTLCMVIAIPGLAGLELLERLRAIHVQTPAILVADPDQPMPAKRLVEACVLDTISTPLQTRELLGWIECVCVTRMLLARDYLIHAQARRRVADQKQLKVA